jgi:hypothetical protein
MTRQLAKTHILELIQEYADEESKIMDWSRSEDEFEFTNDPDNPYRKWIEEAKIKRDAILKTICDEIDNIDDNSILSTYYS